MGDLGPAVSDEVQRLADGLVARESVEDIDVLVTGFGPFKTNPLNPSFLIASALPTTISLPPSPTSPDSPPRRVRIHTHPTPVRVSYSAVRTTVPSIIDSFKNDHDGRPPDLIIHIGMASTRPYYTVETRAHRDGYRITDVDGQVGLDDGETLWKEAGLPAMLEPGLSSATTTTGDDSDGDKTPTPPRAAISTTSTIVSATTTTETTSTSTSDVIRGTITTTITSTAARTPTSPSPPDAHFLKTWRSFLPETADVRLSEDAGRYLCEFIFYTSLAQAWREGRDRSVVFLHVPGQTDEESVEEGKEVAVALVKTLVRCWVE
ncbi:hypothetical protein FQN50_005725 [Emmonsiellopsis sp. PD_5]|nr:hypothetical protein FQN50_005725 [Emmonsiellopsis sp. PD_5]